MVLKYIPSFKGIGETSAIAAAADDAIQETARKILEEAKRLAEEAHEDAFAASLHIDTGARPKGRGYARVVADSDDAEAVEWGDSNKDRRRILGQAAGIKIFADEQ